MRYEYPGDERISGLVPSGGIHDTEEKRNALLDSIEELKACAEYIDCKQTFYNEVLSGKRPYVSSLIR